MIRDDLLQRKLRLGLACALALAGIAFAMNRLRPWENFPPKLTSPVQSAADIAQLKQIVFQSTGRGEGVPAVVAQIGQAVIGRAGSAEPGPLDPARAAALASTVERWLAHYTHPDYARYQTFLAGFARPDQPTGGEPGWPRSLEDFEKRAAPFRHASVAVEGVQVIARALGGKVIGAMPRGVRTTITDGRKRFSGLDTELGPALKLDAYEVRFPIEIQAKSGPHRCYLGLVCVWLPEENAWVPWQVAMEEPTGLVDGVPVPWL